jgi:hypothetical protein
MHYNADIVYPAPNPKTQPIVSTVTKECLKLATSMEKDQKAALELAKDLYTFATNAKTASDKAVSQ